MTKRACGDCTLCCTLLPVAETGKKANTRCPTQGDGCCAIYAQRPTSCRLWSCAWLAGGTLMFPVSGTQRPDLAHYVIDMMPDAVTVNGLRVPAVQVWVDPAFPDAHKDPALRDLIDKAHVAAIIRYGSADGFVAFPPSLTGHGWFEQGGTVVDRQTGEIVRCD